MGIDNALRLITEVGSDSLCDVKILTQAGLSELIDGHDEGYLTHDSAVELVLMKSMLGYGDSC